MAPLGLAESSVFSLDFDLPQDRGVERRVGRCPLGRRPETRDLHRLDHRLAIHRVLRFAKDDDRGFDLADLLGRRFRCLGRFRFLGVSFGHGRGLGCGLGRLYLGRLLRVTCGRGGLGGFGLGRQQLKPIHARTGFNSRSFYDQTKTQPVRSSRVLDGWARTAPAEKHDRFCRKLLDLL